MRTIWWDGPIDQVFRITSSWYDIGNTNNNFSIQYFENVDNTKNKGIFIEIFGIHFIFYFNFLKNIPKFERQWGFSFFCDTEKYPSDLVIMKGHHTKIYDLPWSYVSDGPREIAFFGYGWPQNEVPEYTFCTPDWKTEEEMKLFGYRELSGKNPIDEIDFYDISSVQLFSEYDSKPYYSWKDEIGKWSSKIYSYLNRRKYRRLIWKWLHLPFYKYKYIVNLKFDPHIKKVSNMTFELDDEFLKSLTLGIDNIVDFLVFSGSKTKKELCSYIFNKLDNHIW